MPYVPDANPRPQRGVTLIELAVVLAILVALAGVLVPMFQGTTSTAECTATDASLVAIRDAIMGSGNTPGYLSDMGSYPSHPLGSTSTALFPLHYLFYPWDMQDANCLPPNNPNASGCRKHQNFNPVTQRGWRGPYLSGGTTCGAIKKIIQGLALDPEFDAESRMLGTYTAAYPLLTVCNLGSAAAVSDPDPSESIGIALDSFSVTDNRIRVAPVRSPIQLFRDAQRHHYLVSAGSDGVTTLGNTINPDDSHRGDDRVLYLDAADQWSNKPCTQ